MILRLEKLVHEKVRLDLMKKTEELLVQVEVFTVEEF